MHRRITGRLVIATHNPGKLAEMRELLAPHGVEAVSAGDLGLAEPEETGQTFRANAAIKAIAAAKAAQLPAFADMTSIEKHSLPPLGLGLSPRARAFVKLAEICLG